MSKAAYDQDFYDYTNRLSRHSAEAVVPVVKALLPWVASVADFGCAQGVWLNTWRDNGIDDIKGVDGDYVDRNKLFIPGEAFDAKDLNAPIDLGRRFDLVQSLEVAEHLKPENACAFVESLTRHADVILFSAAPPGQGGEHHINEQPYDYWRALFEQYGYQPFDCVRPRLAGIDGVAFWYRYNTLLYVKADADETLNDDVRTGRVPQNQAIADISPFAFKIRKALVRALPRTVQDALARMKAKSNGG